MNTKNPFVHTRTKAYQTKFGSEISLKTQFDLEKFKDKNGNDLFIKNKPLLWHKLMIGGCNPSHSRRNYY